MRCNICEEDYRTKAEFEAHMGKHVAIEKMPADDSNFIPEIQRDENGIVKPRPYRQSSWEPSTDFGG